MKQKVQEPVVDIKVTIVNGRMILNLYIPYKWLGVILTTYILWRAPELWKVIETTLSLFGK